MGCSSKCHLCLLHTYFISHVLKCWYFLGGWWNHLPQLFACRIVYITTRHSFLIRWSQSCGWRPQNDISWWFPHVLISFDRLKSWTENVNEAMRVSARSSFWKTNLAWSTTSRNVGGSHHLNDEKLLMGYALFTRPSVAVKWQPCTCIYIYIYIDVYTYIYICIYLFKYQQD